jgi:hypothetical protein
MNIYHKNMRQISKQMQSWTESHLSSLGVFDCSYFYLDIQQGMRMPMPMNYAWYCEYMEKNLDLNVTERLKANMAYWNPNAPFYQSYRRHMQHQISEHFFKLDIVNKIHEGYELLSVGSFQPLRTNQLATINFAFKMLSYEAQKIRQQKQNFMVELRPVNELRQLYHYESAS